MCITQDDYEDLKENNALGEDCLPDTDDDPGQCPEGYIWAEAICNCVTYQDPDCGPDYDDEFVCVWDTESFTDPQCNCYTGDEWNKASRSNKNEISKC